MKVSARIAVGGIDTTLTGEADGFGGKRDYMQPLPILPDIGFWLKNWRYDGNSGPASKSAVFVPWTSCAYIIKLED
jgi:hypothetical protein